MHKCIKCKLREPLCSYWDYCEECKREIMENLLSVQKKIKKDKRIPPSLQDFNDLKVLDNWLKDNPPPWARKKRKMSRYDDTGVPHANEILEALTGKKTVYKKKEDCNYCERGWSKGFHTCPSCGTPCPPNYFDDEDE